MKLKRIGALLLVVLLFATPCPKLFASEIPALTARELLARENTPITRAQFAMLINNTFSFEAAAEENFLDVSNEHPYAKDLLIAKGTGYISGDGYGNVNPDIIISGAEAAVIINNILGFDVSKVPLVLNIDIPDLRPFRDIIARSPVLNEAQRARLLRLRFISHYFYVVIAVDDFHAESPHNYIHVLVKRAEKRGCKFAALQFYCLFQSFTVLFLNYR